MKIMRRTSIILTFIIALCCSSLLCSLAYAEDSWSFVALGDTRGEDDTTTGASEYLPAIVSEIATLNPRFVLVGGDLVNGDALSDTPDVNNPRIPYATQFANWKEIMKPLYDAGIDIYPVRGNHENYASDHNPPIPSLKQAYFDAFDSTVPQNGPNNGPDDNQKGFSWALKQKNVRIVTVDQYFYYHPTAVGGRNYFQIDQAWVDAQLSKTAPRPYTFVMAHEPVFSVDVEEGGFYGRSSEGLAARDAFWNSLGANGVKMYLTGHVHNLQVGVALDDSGNPIYQNVLGNGGAKINPISGEHDPRLVPTYSKDDDYGFSLYTVTDNNIIVTYYLYHASTAVWSISHYTVTLLANPVSTWNTPLGTFSAASSWDPHTVPGAADIAVFDSGPGTLSTVDFTADAHNKRLFVASGPVIFNLAGKTYTADSTAIDGSEDASYRPSLTVSGAGSRFNTTSLTMDGISSFIVETGASAACGTITIEGGTATIGGDITAATLDLRANTLTVVGPYTQTAGTTLKLTAKSSSDFGKITSNAAAVVSAGSAVNVTVGGYIPNNAALTILNTGGLGIGNAPNTITSSDSRVKFLGSGSSGNLILTADRSASGFASLASNSNAQAAGAVLDNVTNPSSDMSTVLNTLEGLSDTQTSSALNTLVPAVDAGIRDNSVAMLNNFVVAFLERARSVLTPPAGNSAGTGVSAGDESKVSDPWGKSYGSYLTQGTRKGIQGYDAWNAGTAIGADHLFSDVVTLGICGGYAYGNVDSDANHANTYINSAQTAVYGEYQDKDLPYFINAAGVFAYNWYNGKRDINVGDTILRTANATYEGQQYGAYIGGGYKFNVQKNLELTPLMSLQWNHLHLQSYTETEAEALSLNVASQDYDQLQSGLGVRVAAPTQCKWGTFTPEVHGKWLYDFIGDPIVVPSTFTGGGASFDSNGAKPAQNSFNAGGQLIFDFKNDYSIIAVCDTEMKDGFFGIYGSITLKHSF